MMPPDGVSQYKVYRLAALLHRTQGQNGMKKIAAYSLNYCKLLCSHFPFKLLSFREYEDLGKNFSFKYFFPHITAMHTLVLVFQYKFH